MESCCSTRTKQVTVLALSTIASAGCLYLIYKKYLRQVADYRKQMASLDPARVAEWKSLRGYQRVCEEIRGDYERINTVTRQVPKLICQGPEGPIYQNVLETRWVENITSEAFILQVRKNPKLLAKLEKACQKAHRRVDDAFAEIISNQIIAVGPKPYPVSPSAQIAALKATGATALLCGGAFAYWQFHAKRAG